MQIYTKEQLASLQTGTYIYIRRSLHDAGDVAVKLSTGMWDLLYEYATPEFIMMHRCVEVINI